jgi:hypothetical protein
LHDRHAGNLYELEGFSAPIRDASFQLIDFRRVPTGGVELALVSGDKFVDFDSGRKIGSRSMSLSKGMVSSMIAVSLSLGSMSAGAFTIVSSIGGAPSAGVTKWNFDTPGDVSQALDLPTGVSSITFNPDAKRVTGSVSGQYAAPYLSGGNGAGFGPGGTDQANGPDATPYLTTGSTGSVPGAGITIEFSTALRYLGLLWGSVDTYNTVTFLMGNVAIGSITGSDVLASPVGNQGENGTVYVNINSDVDFDKVVFTSSQYAFEFDNLAFGERPITPVPIPAAAWLLGSGLLALFGVARRKRG